jgi:dsDNA-specific endonuclease/ATPase MutS2
MLLCTRDYLKETVASMNEFVEVASSMSTYTPFVNDLLVHKERIQKFLQKMSSISFSLNQCGTLRSLFYELYDHNLLKETVQYSIHYHGFLQNIQHVHKTLGKKMNACSFCKTTSFSKAFYPIQKPVKNSYTLDKNIIITGPNASGKTTLIKSTLINVLLSQQLGCGFYKKATICPYDKFFSYINIPDTSGRDSLFQAEARRCKEIINEVSTNKRILCIFDELFSGTNPQEACSSATALLKHLSAYDTFTFLLTTHFVDVCTTLSCHDTIIMKHMKTEGTDTLTYFYLLVNGISKARGGIKVLEQLNFPKTILNDAKICG